MLDQSDVPLLLYDKRTSSYSLSGKVMRNNSSTLVKYNYLRTSSSTCVIERKKAYMRNWAPFAVTKNFLGRQPRKLRR